MDKLHITEPKYVESMGRLVEMQKNRLIRYATDLGKDLFHTYEKLQEQRPIEHVHLQCDHSFKSLPDNEHINIAYDIFGDAENKKIRFIDAFIQVGGWTWLKFEITKDDSDDADSEKESVQGEVPVHDESSDQGV